MKKVYFFAAILVFIFLFFYFGNFNLTGKVITDSKADLNEGISESEERKNWEENKAGNEEESFVIRLKDKVVDFVKGENRDSQEDFSSEDSKYKEGTFFKLDILPTKEWFDFYGEIKFKGNPAKVGSEVAVIDSQKRVIGFYAIKRDGNYGFLHVYLDEEGVNGARFGEEIYFVFYDGFGKEYETGEIFVVGSEKVVELNLNFK